MTRRYPIIHACRPIRGHTPHGEEVDLEFQNGERRTYRRMLMSGFGAVYVVALEDPETVLLIREYSCGMDHYELGPVKGRIDEGEHPLETANRELMEEIGFGAKKLDHIRKISLNPNYMTHAADLVIARDLYPASMEGDEPETLEIVRWPLAKLEDLLLRDDVTDGRAIAALFTAREWLARNP